MTTEPAVDNRARQRELYGHTLHDLLSAVMNTYGLTQRRLASVLEISAPMLSQLMSAKRVKMGNPRAHDRMQSLLQQAGDQGVDLSGLGTPGFAPAPLPPELASAILERVTSSEPSATVQMRRRHGADPDRIDRDLVVQGLRAHVGAGELDAAREALAAGQAPALLALLDDARS